MGEYGVIPCASPVWTTEVYTLLETAQGYE